MTSSWSHGRVGFLSLVVTVALAAGSSGSADAAGGLRSVADDSAPTCIGAATLDPTSGCVDRLTGVYPSVIGPRFEPWPPCRRIRAAPAANSCVLGARASRARLQFALIGDSHTEAWAAVLGQLGRERGWRGTVFTGFGCWMSEAVYDLPPILRESCVPAYRQTMRFLARHPEIDVVFTIHEVDKGLVGPVATIEPRKIRGFKKTFKRYPRNVRRVIVLRDTPNAVQAQFDCLASAVRAAQAPAGPQCASPRRQALLLADAAATAAISLHSSRYQVVDMNDLMCSSTLCYPALGGVLVNADTAGHLTQAFAMTMKPQLLRRLDPLLPKPRP